MPEEDGIPTLYEGAEEPAEKVARAEVWDAGHCQ